MPLFFFRYVVVWIKCSVLLDFRSVALQAQKCLECETALEFKKLEILLARSRPGCLLPKKLKEAPEGSEVQNLSFFESLTRNLSLFYYLNDFFCDISLKFVLETAKKNERKNNHKRH